MTVLVLVPAPTFSRCEAETSEFVLGPNDKDLTDNSRGWHVSVTVMLLERQR